MENFLTVDEIIDKNAFNVRIFKHVRLHDPGFIMDFELFAINVAGNDHAIWWTSMHEKVMEGTVYVFDNDEDFNKFKKMNSNFLTKINFIL